MIDGYFHLDARQHDPLADLDERLASAGAGRALVVETWAGNERSAIETLIASGGASAVAVCFRDQPAAELVALLGREGVWALRVKTRDLESNRSWLQPLVQSRRLLLVHAEHGIERLTRALAGIVAAHPRLPIYVPHLGWPRREKIDDPEWPGGIATLAAWPNVVLGISALGHFAREPFPHHDLCGVAQSAIALFGPRRLMAATDYPNLEPNLYAESYHLARRWIAECWREWNDDHVLRS